MLVTDVAFDFHIREVQLDVRVLADVDLETEIVTVKRIALPDDEQFELKPIADAKIRARMNQAAIEVAADLWDFEGACDRLAEEAGDLEREAG